jgi:hypothetical protein
VENLQLRSTFPGKRLIKTYDALWESCRSIAPLQLFFSEIFDLVGTFWSFAISKRPKRIKLELGVGVAALQNKAGTPARSATRRSTRAPVYGSRGNSGVDPRPSRGASVRLWTVRRAQGRDRRGLAAGPSGHALAQAATQGTPGACKRPAGREALRPAAEPSPASVVMRARHEAYRALSRGRRRRPVPVCRSVSPPASCSTPHPPPRDPCASLHSSEPPPGPSAALPLPCGALQRACRGCMLLVASAAFSGPVAALQPSSKVSSSPSSLLRPTSAAAGRQFHHRRGPDSPGTTLQERRYFQGDLCKFPGTRL